MRSTDHELSCRVYEILDVAVEEPEHFLSYLLLHSRYEDVYHVLADFLEHSLVVVGTVGILDEVVVLCTYNNGVYTLRHTIVAILYRYLAL